MLSLMGVLPITSQGLLVFCRQIFGFTLKLPNDNEEIFGVFAVL